MSEELPSVAAEALAKYSPTDAAIAQMRSEYMPIRVSGVDDKAGAEKAHGARMVVKNHRVAIEKTRVSLKADALAFGRAVDSEAKRLTSMLEPIENHLREQEEIVTKEAERRRLAEEAERIEILRGRMVALADVRSPLIEADVARMSDAEFQSALNAANEAYFAAIEAERVAAEERRIESERLAAERADLERQRAAQESERMERERVLAAERAAHEAEVAKIREQQDAERRRIEAERAAIEAEKAAAARAAEIKAAEERAAAAAREQARIDAERAEAERARKEAMRPTVEKLTALADAVIALTVPDFQATAEVRQVLARAAQEIRAIAAR